MSLSTPNRNNSLIPSLLRCIRYIFHCQYCGASIQPCHSSVDYKSNIHFPWVKLTICIRYLPSSRSRTPVLPSNHNLYISLPFSDRLDISETHIFRLSPNPTEPPSQISIHRFPLLARVSAPLLAHLNRSLALSLCTPIVIHDAISRALSEYQASTRPLIPHG
jgi:hypothetical protein